MLSVAVAAAAIATPAMAQDDSHELKGGARVEARVGFDHVVFSVDGASEGRSGLAYGGEAGYDLNVSNFVIGGYAGIEGSTTKECEDGVCISAGRNITAGVRAGGVVGRGLLYVKGGYSNGRINVSFDGDSDGQAFDGFHVGGGYEVNLSRHTYAKAEYVFTKYSTPSEFDGLDIQRHQALVGFGYRF
jgi:outer membrane immunogenic protein